MNQTNYFKIFAFVAFLVLMAISCWASVQSLHLRLPDWPITFFWAISVVFFVVSSLGVKLIVDCFNQHLRIDNRGWRLTGGVLLLLVFWVIFSIPTNTHTFFYRSAIRDILTQDLTNTNTELNNLLNTPLSEQEKKNRLRQISPQYDNVIHTIKDLMGKCDAVQKKVIEYQKIEPKLGILIHISERAASLKTDLENERQTLLPYASAIQQVGMSETKVGTDTKQPTSTGGDTGTDVKPSGGDMPLPNLV